MASYTEKKDDSTINTTTENEEEEDIFRLDINEVYDQSTNNTLDNAFAKYMEIYDEIQQPSYCGLNYLTKNSDLPHNGETSIRYYIVPYHVTNTGTIDPFVQIMFKKNPFYEELEFLELDASDYNISSLNDTSKTINAFANYMSENMHSFCGYTHLTPDFFKEKYMGMYSSNTINNDSVYVFFDISSINIENIFVGIDSLVWFGLADEILNKRCVYNLPIFDDIYTFFSYHEYFLHVFNPKKNTIFDVPVVAYVAENTMQKAKFTNVFGTSRVETPYGYFFSLTDYDTCIKTKNTKKLVRFAFFYKKSISVEIFTQNNQEEREKEEDKKNIGLSILNDEKNVLICKNDKGNDVWLFNTYHQQVPLTYHDHF